MPHTEPAPVRSYLPAYLLENVGNLEKALERMVHEPGVWKPFAGGTDLMVLLEAGRLPHRNFLDISRLRELGGIALTPEHLAIGALTTYTEVRQHSVLA